MEKKRNLLFLALFGGALLIVLSLILVYFLLLSSLEKDFVFGDAVAVVDVQGEIFYNRAKIREIEKYRENKRIKAVVLHINSPGGGVAASQEMYHSILKLKEKKPVVACMGEIAASGGYYVACAADSIVAYEGTLTGSIGVLAMFWRTEELFEKIGLDVTVIKSGRYKDIGSPFREMTGEEKAYLERLLDNVYQQFLRSVSEGRGIPVDRVVELAEGRLYSGEEALRQGLVDRLGTYEDAIEMAARMGGIKGKPRVVRKRKRKTFFEGLLGRGGSVLPIGRGGERVTLKYIVP